MKIRHLFLGLMALSIVSACQKDEIMKYEQAAGVYFDGTASTYSFIEHLDKQKIGFDTVNIPVMITGMAVDYDRKFNLELVPEDTAFTAESDMFELIDGFVGANQYTGKARVRINYSEALENAIYTVCFRIKGDEDFAVTDLNAVNYQLNFTSEIIKPANWKQIGIYFYGADYSKSWYKFILEVTGLSYIPYWYSKSHPKNPDPEYYWMEHEEALAYANKVKAALLKYNREHEEPLRHQDGEKKGFPVKMAM